MELDEFRSAWNTPVSLSKTPADIKTMLSENRHPVLKQIRRQSLLEIAGWTIFLACCYTMFDGDRKPLWINITLVISVLLPLAHNTAGYLGAKNLVKGTDLKRSLENYHRSLKTFAALSVAARTLFGTGLVLFFTYGLRLNLTRMLSLGAIALVFALQIWLLLRMWNKRISLLGKTISALR
ncbi:hypothetical protein [Hufsiella ginkgonis]|uniref:DUF3278 domain-containing protein n=1 Tax=Hufsiella ginkgonis TaxID=2695274 RepID=A0A7K1XXD9_9SPHI|nr:hypothetical protein [Hufsiella ginkgonis]MXV15612.1 hypothetical protein [Hufsiella ginkgonis]